MLVWLLCTNVTGVFAAANNVVTAPLVYDFVPRDKMGTISSGCGYIGGFASVLLANAGGYWIYHASLHLGPGQAADYASNFAYQFSVGVVAFIALTFLMRAVRRGQVVEFGRLGLNSNEAPIRL